MQAQLLDNYVNTFSAFNEVPPQLEAFIKGLKALNNNDVRMCKFTFNDMFHTVLVPNKFFKGVNLSSQFRQFIVKMLLKRDITTVSVYEFNSIMSQVRYNDDYTMAYLPTYNFLREGFNDKCRHTVIKYYSLDNPKTNVAISKG